MPETLGDRIKRVRKERGLGLRETAGKIGISATFLSRVETNAEQSAPSEDVLRKLAKVIEDDFDAIMQLDVGLRAVPDSAGKAQLVVAGVEDVTGRSELEVELRHSQKLESVGRLAAGIAHEINTPIQFVGDNVNFLSGAFQQLLELCASYRSACSKAAHAPLSAEDVARLKRDEELADLEYLQANVSSSIASTVDGIGRVACIVQSVKAFAQPDRHERASADLNAALRDTLTVAINEKEPRATATRKLLVKRPQRQRLGATGSIENEVVGEIGGASFECIQKPFDAVVLSAKVQELLQKTENGPPGETRPTDRPLHECPRRVVVTW
jgi:transcriptional regulator with XRE-family HTH domain